MCALSAAGAEIEALYARNGPLVVLGEPAADVRVVGIT